MPYYALLGWKINEPDEYVFISLVEAKNRDDAIRYFRKIYGGKRMPPNIRDTFVINSNMLKGVKIFGTKL